MKGVFMAKPRKTILKNNPVWVEHISEQSMVQLATRSIYSFGDEYVCRDTRGFAWIDKKENIQKQELVYNATEKLFLMNMSVETLRMESPCFMRSERLMEEVFLEKGEYLFVYPNAGRYVLKYMSVNGSYTQEPILFTFGDTWKSFDNIVLLEYKHGPRGHKK